MKYYLLFLLFFVRICYAETSIICVGDSITNGGIGANGGYLCWLRVWNNEFKFFGKTEEHPVETLGYNNYTTTDILTNIDTWLDQYFPVNLKNPYVVLMCGNNDCVNSFSTETSMSNYTAILSAILTHNPNIKIIVCLIPPFKDSTDSKAVTFNIALSALIVTLDNPNIIQCDVNSAIKAEPDWKALYYTVDNTHPNDMGLHVIATEIYKYLPHKVIGTSGITINNLIIDNEVLTQ